MWNGVVCMDQLTCTIRYKVRRAQTALIGHASSPVGAEEDVLLAKKVVDMEEIGASFFGGGGGKCGMGWFVWTR